MTDKETKQEPLAQPQPVQFKCTVVDDGHPNGVPLSQWGRQPEQEPVAWITPDGVMVDKQGVKSYLSIVGTKFVGRPLYTAPPSIEAAVLAEREACIEWLRNNYQDYKNISDICDAIRARGEK